MQDPSVASALLATGLYWEIEAGAPEWVWVVQRMIEEFCADAQVEGALPPHGVYFNNRTPVYLILKTLLPFPVLFSRLGMKEGTTEAQCRKIKLKEIPVNEDLPQPTVDYWGIA